MSRSDQEDVAVFLGLTYGFWLLILLTLGIISGGLWLLRPFILGQEHKQNVASHQFVESKITKLQIHAEAWIWINTRIMETTDPDTKAALIMQQKVIKGTLKREAARIPPADIPPEIKVILEQAEQPGGAK